MGSPKLKKRRGKEKLFRTAESAEQKLNEKKQRKEKYIHKCF